MNAQEYYWHLDQLDRQLQQASGAQVVPLAARAGDLAAALQPVSAIKPALTVRYLVKGLLDRGALSIFFGESNVGKTFLALDIGFHIAAGVDWHGHKVPTGEKWPGPVVYLAAEGGRGVYNRIEALRRAKPDLMRLVEKREAFSILPTAVDLCTSNDAEYLIAAIRQHCKQMPSLIVVDTLARTMGQGDENHARDMGQFVRNLDLLREVTGAHVMVIHHSGKDTSKGARGSGSLRAAADTEVELTRHEEVVTAEARKQRDMACDAIFSYRLQTVLLGVDEDGDKVTSAVVEKTDVQRTDKRERLSGRDQVALSALHDALRDKGRIIRSADLPNVPVVELSEWQACCDRVGLTDSDKADTKARTFRRHRDNLMDKNRIRIFDSYVWATDKADNARTKADTSAAKPDGHGHPPIRVSDCPDAPATDRSDDFVSFNDPNAGYWPDNQQ